MLKSKIKYHSRGIHDLIFNELSLLDLTKTKHQIVTFYIYRIKAHCQIKAHYQIKAHWTHSWITVTTPQDNHTRASYGKPQIPKMILYDDRLNIQIKFEFDCNSWKRYSLFIIHQKGHVQIVVKKCVQNLHMHVT